MNPIYLIKTGSTLLFLFVCLIIVSGVTSVLRRDVSVLSVNTKNDNFDLTAATVNFLGQQQSQNRQSYSRSNTWWSTPPRVVPVSTASSTGHLLPTSPIATSSSVSTETTPITIPLIPTPAPPVTTSTVLTKVCPDLVVEVHSNSAQPFCSGDSVPTGKYKISYVTGAQKFTGDIGSADNQNWRFGAASWNTTYIWNLYFNNGTIQLGGPNAFSEFVNYSDAVSAYTGWSADFDHVGGQIGIVLGNDPVPEDNLCGTSCPTFRLQSITVPPVATTTPVATSTFPVVTTTFPIATSTLIIATTTYPVATTTTVITVGGLGSNAKSLSGYNGIYKWVKGILPSQDKSVDISVGLSKPSIVALNLSTAIESELSDNPDQPILVIGHSVGAFVAYYVAQSYKNDSNIKFIFVDPPYKFFVAELGVSMPGGQNTVQGSRYDKRTIDWTLGNGIWNFVHHDAFDFPTYTGQRLNELINTELHINYTKTAPNGKTNATNLANLKNTILRVLSGM